MSRAPLPPGRRPMLPGAYLQKRRAMAGYSLSALARDLIVLDGFGRTRDLSTHRRLQLRLLSAEDSVLHLDRRLRDLVRNFVAFDPAVYDRLIENHEASRAQPVPDICRVCGCSFYDPCVTPPRGTSAPLGRATCRLIEPDLCSTCVAAELAAPAVPPPPFDAAIRLVPTGEF